jgi:sugar O-acyltransferase (sialic acid O-acetyltransferase NeuD family)
MTRKPLVIFGITQSAELAEFYFRHDVGLEVAAFTVDGSYLTDSVFCGKPVVPFENIATDFTADEHEGFVALGYTKLNTLRAQKYAEMKAKGYRLASYVSSKATIWPGFAAGDNCFILEDNTIQPFARIGSNVTLWSGNHIGHHSRIGDHVFVASHVVISGGVEVGDYSFIGVNATIRDRVRIGERCVLGAGTLITEDAAPEGVYIGPKSGRAGVPSSRLRKI